MNNTPAESAHYETCHDGAGPYFAIYLLDVMVAYAVTESAAQVIVKALQMANKLALRPSESEPVM